METKEEYDTVLASLDVRDAFLQVDQDNPVLVKLQGENWVIKKKYLRNHLQETMDFEFSMEQPCMARTKECTIIIHVDDILFVGLKTFWTDVFLPNMSQKFSISHDQLQGNGTSIKFLRRTITEVPEVLVLSPGTSVSKVVQLVSSILELPEPKRFRVIPVCNWLTTHRNLMTKMLAISEAWLDFACMLEGRDQT